jgi:hypothetical protein
MVIPAGLPPSYGDEEGPPSIGAAADHHPYGGGWFRNRPTRACLPSGVKEPRRPDTPVWR